MGSVLRLLGVGDATFNEIAQEHFDPLRSFFPIP